MRRLLTGTAATFLLLAALPGAALAQGTTVTQQELRLVTCPQPTLTVALGTVDCKAALCSNPAEPTLSALFGGAGYVQTMGHGLGSMLITALRGTNCFRIIDLDEIRKVQEKLQATGQQVKPPQIDRLINLTISSIELSGQRGGGVIVPLPFVGGVGVRIQQAALGVDVSVLDPSTLEVKDARGFSANSKSTSLAVGGGGLVGGTGLGAGWEWSHNVVLDAVARDVIVHVANYLATSLAGAQAAK
jgi:curli biogenesis system outer membrane secretion channel CsgG